MIVCLVICDLLVLICVCLIVLVGLGRFWLLRLFGCDWLFGVCFSVVVLDALCLRTCLVFIGYLLVLFAFAFGLFVFCCVCVVYLVYLCGELLVV